MAKVQWNYSFFLKAVLTAYFIGLIWVLFVNVGGTDRSTYFVNPDDHYLPFESSRQMIKAARVLHYEPYYVLTVLANIGGNIVLFMPFGFLMPLVSRYFQSFNRVAISAFIMSFIIEAIQFIFSIGIFDVDDIIYNTTGAFCGFLLLYLVRFFRRFPETTHPFYIDRSI